MLKTMETKRCKVVMLPTNKASQIALCKYNERKGIFYGEVPTIEESLQNQNLYIIDDSEIKEGDWYYISGGIGQSVGIYQAEKDAVNNDWRHKIIATTDDKLWHSASDKYGQGCALIPKSFIKEYCRKGGVDEVDVEYIVTVPKYELELKVNPRHEITIHPIEAKLYTREEVEQMLHDIVNDSHCKPERIVQPNSNKCAEFVLNWIKKRL